MSLIYIFILVINTNIINTQYTKAYVEDLVPINMKSQL